MINSEELGFLQEFKHHRGWAIYKTLLGKKFASEYTKLRKFNSEKDGDYARKNGMLDGIEYAMGMLDEVINENKGTDTQP